ncbi:MAG: hypothetical protein ACRCVS_03205 [Fusobacteriaceae bacterium]
MLIISTLSLAFKIDEVNFGKEIEKGKKESKIFTLGNNNEENRIYRLSVEGSNDVKISPNILNLKSLQKKEFKVEVEGKASKGSHSYFLVIKEIKSNKIKSNKIKNSVGIDKIVKFKQSYVVK